MTTPNDILHTDALKTASLWFVQLTSGEVTDADRLAWQAWRQQDPANEYAWQQVEKVTRKFSVPGISPAVGLATLERPNSPARRRALQQLAVIFAVGGASWAGYRHTPWQAWSADFETAVGEQRKINLQDGSQLTLNTNSAVDIFFTQQERRVSLRKGEILIETAQEKTDLYRPFIAATQHGNAIALGTRFTLRTDNTSSRVSLYDGAVDIHIASSSSKATHRLHAGEAIDFTAGEFSLLTVLLSSQPHWLNGILVADDMPLNNFIEEVARYRHGVLSGDASLDNMRISGAFPIDNTDRILDSLTTTLPVKVQRFTDYWVKVKQRA
jgi:transmembrane sensor